MLRWLWNKLALLVKAAGALTLAVYFLFSSFPFFPQADQKFSQLWETWLLLLVTIPHKITPPSLANLIFNLSHFSDQAARVSTKSHRGLGYGMGDEILNPCLCQGSPASPMKFLGSQLLPGCGAHLCQIGIVPWERIQIFLRDFRVCSPKQSKDFSRTGSLPAELSSSPSSCSHLLL